MKFDLEKSSGGKTSIVVMATIYFKEDSSSFYRVI